jgi:hypothetical protein
MLGSVIWIAACFNAGDSAGVMIMVQAPPLGAGYTLLQELLWKKKVSGKIAILLSALRLTLAGGLML